MSNKLKIGLFFGGRSTEHEVSVITALQAFENLDLSKYEVIPIYVDKEGEFYTNAKFLSFKSYKDVNSLLLSSKKVILCTKDSSSGILYTGLFPKFVPLSLAFPVFHGSFGEDGCIQGVFEIHKIPYVGFNVLGSALGMDKIAQKAIFKSLGLNIGKYTFFKRLNWIDDPKKCLNQVKKELKFPLFVKPNTGGSTIGVSYAKNMEELEFSIEVASTYADKILVEEAFEDVIEINCAALGYKNVKPSVCEMPVRTSETLSYDDKYKNPSLRSGTLPFSDEKGKSGGKMFGSKGSKGGGMSSMSRVIPAQISDKLAKEIQDATIKVFKALDGCGVARIDFFVDKDKEKFWINEINTIPGSLSFYLYEPLGIKYTELLDIIIQAGLDRFEDQKKTQYSFNSDLLEEMAKS